MIINMLMDKRKLMKAELLKRYPLIIDQSLIKKKDLLEDLIKLIPKWNTEILELNNQSIPECLMWEVIIIYRLILELIWIPQPDNGSKQRLQLIPQVTIINHRLQLILQATINNHRLQLILPATIINHRVWQDIPVETVMYIELLMDKEPHLLPNLRPWPITLNHR